MGGIHLDRVETVQIGGEGSFDGSRASTAVLTVKVVGALDAATTTELRHVLVEAIMRRRPAELIIDLDSVTVLDPAALGALEAAQGMAADLDVRLTVRRSRLAL